MNTSRCTTLGLGEKTKIYKVQHSPSPQTYKIRSPIDERIRLNRGQHIAIKFAKNVN